MTVWMLVLLACAKNAAVDPTADLPEANVRVEVDTARAELERLAAELDPALRGRALSLLILTAPEPAGGTFSQRGLWDPAAWVQRRTAESLLQRLDEPESVAALEAYVARDQGDAYVRGWVALRLADQGYTGSDEALQAAWRAEPMGWARAPLALAAARMGDAAAWGAVEEAVKFGDLALETTFVLDLANSGRAELLPALEEASGMVEEELLLPLATARMVLGDPAGERLLQQALNGDDALLSLEALDYLSGVDSPQASRLVKLATNRPDPLTATYAQLVLASRGEAPAATFAAAATSDDWEVRDLAVRWAGQALDAATDKALRTVAERTIRGALLDDDATVRATAIEQLARLGLTGEREALTANLAHETGAVRVEAAGALLLQPSL